MRPFDSCLLLLLVHACGLGLLFVPAALGYYYGGGGGGGFPSSPPPSDDPYRILGVGPDCTNEEIRASYRRKCLLTHPDKTLHLSEAERKAREEAFKKVQRAYEFIGDPERRKQYDASTAWTRPRPPPTRQQHPYQQEKGSESSRSSTSSSSNTGSSSFGNFGTYRFDATGSQHPFVHFQFWQPDMAAGGVPRGKGAHPSPPPPPPPHRRTRRHHRRSTFLGPWGDLVIMGFGPASSMKLRSVFVQDVPVPLEDLYAGTTIRVRFRPGMFDRVVAAFRGGIGPLLVLQSLLFALPFLRSSRIAAASCALYAFHYLLSPDDESTHGWNDNYNDEKTNAYSIRVLPGYKGGTKITYDEDDVQVVFVLRELEHNLYWRMGNDLHTSVTISPKQARDGCTARVPALDRTQPDISVRIPAGLAQRHTSHRDDARDEKAGSNTMIVVKGQGWPIRRPRKDGAPNPSKGDLIVHVHVDDKRRRTSE